MQAQLWTVMVGMVVEGGEVDPSGGWEPHLHALNEAKTMRAACDVRITCTCRFLFVYVCNCLGVGEWREKE